MKNLYESILSGAQLNKSILNESIFSASKPQNVDVNLFANTILSDVFDKAYPRWKDKVTWSWDSGTVTIKDPHHDIWSFDLDTIEELRSKGITVTDLCIDDAQVPVSGLHNIDMGFQNNKKLDLKGLNIHIPQSGDSFQFDGSPHGQIISNINIDSLSRVDLRNMGVMNSVIRAPKTMIYIDTISSIYDMGKYFNSLTCDISDKFEYRLCVESGKGSIIDIFDKKAQERITPILSQFENVKSRSDSNLFYNDWGQDDIKEIVHDIKDHVDTNFWKSSHINIKSSTHIRVLFFDFNRYGDEFEVLFSTHPADRMVCIGDTDGTVEVNINGIGKMYMGIVLN